MASGALSRKQALKADDINAKPKIVKASAAPQGSLREDLRRFTREKIVDAALKSFADIGFRATSVERIVDLAGTTAPTFYRHFSGKNDLLIPLRSHLAAEVTNVVIKLENGAWQNQAGIRAWVDEYMTMWRRVHRLCDAFWEATNETNEFAAGAIPETVSIVAKMAGFIGTVNPKKRLKTKIKLAMLILCMDRMAVLADAENDAEKSNQLLDEFSEILWASVFSGKS